MKKECKTCIHFPCYKNMYDIEKKIKNCKDYLSIKESAIKIIKKCSNT